MSYTVGKLSAPRSIQSSHFLRRVKWRNAMGHNKINTLCVVWAVTFEQMKMKAKFFLLGTWCYSFLWFETQSTVQKEVFIIVAMRTISAHFSQNCLFKNSLSGDRKSTRLNSSHLVISYAVFCLKKKKQKTTPHHHLTKLNHLSLPTTYFSDLHCILFH